MLKNKVPLNQKKLWANFVNAEKFKDTDLAWVLDTPYNVWDGVVDDFMNGWKSNEGKEKPHKFRSRKIERGQSITVRTKAWKFSGVLYSLEKVAATEPFLTNYFMIQD